MLDGEENSPFSTLVLKQGFVSCKSGTTNLPLRFRLEEWDEKFSIYISHLALRGQGKQEKEEMQRLQNKGATYHDDSIPNCLV